MKTVELTENFEKIAKNCEKILVFNVTKIETLFLTKTLFMLIVNKVESSTECRRGGVVF